MGGHSSVTQLLAVITGVTPESELPLLTGQQVEKNRRGVSYFI